MCAVGSMAEGRDLISGVLLRPGYQTVDRLMEGGEKSSMLQYLER
jgi:hypothetical protein